GCIQPPADNVITHTRQVLHPSTPHEHHRVLLEVVADPGNISRYLDPVGQANPRIFPERRVRLLGSHRPDPGADTAPLRGVLGSQLFAETVVTVLQSRRRRFGLLPLPPFPDELVDCRQTCHLLLMNSRPQNQAVHLWTKEGNRHPRTIGSRPATAARGFREHTGSPRDPWEGAEPHCFRIAAVAAPTSIPQALPSSFMEST